MTARRDDPMYRNSGYFSAVFLTLAFLGWVFPHDGAEPPPDTDCSPVHTADHPGARDALLGQGYQPAGAGTVVRPGCEP